MTGEQATLAAPRVRLDSWLDPLGSLLLRVVAGGFLAAHGWPKWAAGVEVFAEGHLAFIAFWVVWPNGFAWTRGGWEYPALWAAAMLAIALRGGGPWSLDRLLFRR